MNASEIIVELQRLIQIHGDVPVKQVLGSDWGKLVQDLRYSSSSCVEKPHIKLISHP